MKKKSSTKEQKKPRSAKEIEHDFYIIDDIVYFALRGRAQKEGLFTSVSFDKWPFVSKYDWYLSKNGYPMCYDVSC